MGYEKTDRGLHQSERRLTMTSSRQPNYPYMSVDSAEVDDCSQYSPSAPSTALSDSYLFVRTAFSEN